MLVKLYPENPNSREIRKIVNLLEKGGVIIYPTDTIYGIGCDITKPRSIERIAQIKGLNPQKNNFSFICHDLSHISDFTRQLSNPVYKLMKRNLPGPFTFVLEANNNVPKLLKSKKKTVGIRVPDNNIIREIVRELGHPILTTSIHSDDEVLEYITDPELIHDKYKDLVDLVIDGGYGNNVASTVIDCTGDEIAVIREGVGILEE